MLSGLDRRNLADHRRDERLMKPLAIELFCGTFGWSAGWLNQGGQAIGFDLEHLPHHGPVPNGAELVLQDVLTLHGSQFKNADLILASPPCPEYSYLAMPWKRGKQIAAALRGRGEFPEGYRGSRTVRELNALFNACFRIQREAIAAAGRYIPMVVENVKGAQPWVGPAKAHFGSFYLWGDVESVGGRIVAAGQVRFGAQQLAGASRKNGHIGGGSWFNIGSPGQTNTNSNPDGRKVPGFNFHEHENGKPGRSFQSAAVETGRKGFTTGLGKGHDWRQDPSGRFNSKSTARKAASATIAKIPLPLSTYIAASFNPTTKELPLHELYQNEGPGVRDTR